MIRPLQPIITSFREGNRKFRFSAWKLLGPRTDRSVLAFERTPRAGPEQARIAAVTDLANQRSDLADALGSLSVVIPAYNAKAYVDSTLDEVQAFLTARGLPHEIIVVDDGSTDD